MKRHLTRYAAATVVLILALAGGVFLFEKGTLNRYRHFVESRYHAELSLIENEMRAGKKYDLNEDIETCEARNRVRDRIGQALSGSEVFAVSWSLDGHHGLEGLKQLPIGYRYSPVVGSADSDRSHTLYFGQAEDGTKLLIYVGRVQSDWKREYNIAFRRSEIDQKMSSNVQPSGAATGSQPIRSETNSRSSAAGSRR